MQYEINYLVLQSKTAELEKIRQDVKKMIETAGATITGEKTYLKRKLAYEIKHEGYGFFTVLRFELDDPEKLASLKKELNLLPYICRHILVKADSLPALPEQITAIEEKTEEKPVSAKTASVAAPVEPTAPAVTAEPVKEEKTEKIETPAESSIAEMAPAEVKKEEKTAEEKTEDKTEAAPEDKKVKKPATEKKAKTTKKAEELKDDKASLDELDKKLDEILNS